MELRPGLRPKGKEAAGTRLVIFTREHRNQWRDHGQTK
jgi:hypothetical protein